MLTTKGHDLKGQWKLKNGDSAEVLQGIVDLDKGTYWQGNILNIEENRTHRKLHIWNDEGKSTFDKKYDLAERRRGPEQPWTI